MPIIRSREENTEPNAHCSPKRKVRRCMLVREERVYLGDPKRKNEVPVEKGNHGYKRLSNYLYILGPG